MPKYTGKDCRIDVTGISELALLAELHNHTITSDELKSKAVIGDIDMQDAATGYKHEAPYFPEYLFGRPIKASLKHINARIFLVDCDLYDESAGPGVALEAVHRALSYRQVSLS